VSFLGVAIEAGVLNGARRITIIAKQCSLGKV